MESEDRRDLGSDGLDAAFVRDLEAAGRDRAAERRDAAAAVRDEAARSGTDMTLAGRRSAAHDREDSARDRIAAAADRRAAGVELADEGTDELTGVLRRGVGLAAVRREIARAERGGGALTLAFVDVVGLKQTNDTAGHAAGDRVLREVAACLIGDLRSYDVVVRVGGDEFVCALPGETLENARRRYEQISAHLEARDGGAAMTVGLAELGIGDSLETLIDRADRAMLATRR